MQSDNIMFQVFMWVMLCFSFFQIAASFRLHQPMQHTNWQIVNAVGKELTTRMIPMAKSRKIDVERQGYESIPHIFDKLAKTIGDEICTEDYIHMENNNCSEYSYRDIHEMIEKCAAALQNECGVQRSECIAMFAENSYKWLILDQAIMKCGAHNAVRGVSAPVSELTYIYKNSNCVALVVETSKQLNGLIQAGFFNESSADAVRFVLVLYSDIDSPIPERPEHGLHNKTVFTFEELLAKGKSDSFKQVVLTKDTLATIVYTSGTTSNPKGVMLTHGNLLSQVLFNSFSRAPGRPLDPIVGDTMLSILPCWHIFERAAEYCFLAHGARLCYSSIKTLKTDLESKRPHYIVAVPRLYESLYKSITGSFKQQRGIKGTIIQISIFITKLMVDLCNCARGLDASNNPNIFQKGIAGTLALMLWPIWKITDYLVWSKVRDNLGGRVKVMVSGGALLPPYLEKFYSMTGLQLLAGYGLTETSPVVCNQLAERKIMGSIGALANNTNVKVVDPISRREVNLGDEGVLIVKGPGVMVGYINDAAATKTAFDADGYFDTGDLVRVLPSSADLVITGRYKDTIVLSNGENISPQPIEDAIVGVSDLVDQAMVIGQDEKAISAVLVLNIPSVLAQKLISPSEATSLSTLILDVASARVAGTVSGDLQKRIFSAITGINDNSALKRALYADLEKLSAQFKPWERVKGLILLFEPFSLGNQQLTQTLKTKRHQVLKDYNLLFKQYLPRGGNKKLFK